MDRRRAEKEKAETMNTMGTRPETTTSTQPPPIATQPPSTNTTPTTNTTGTTTTETTSTHSTSSTPTTPSANLTLPNQTSPNSKKRVREHKAGVTQAQQKNTTTQGNTTDQERDSPELKCACTACGAEKLPAVVVRALQ
eukprot:TRINITY_DN68161_c3_g2_i1.p2 TRINITY_DN68161_c3_g2~~TRINITY_DN68161_c3_g2_i1.p2  ORF type:complete len:139 (+),score=32.06 TRINITY_DN68161_c3_g2_i1:774-1190(+)